MGNSAVMEFDIETLVSGSVTHGAMASFRECTPAGAGPPLHRHRDQIEVFHVIRGRYRFLLEGDSIDAGPGDCITVPAGATHAFRNLLDETSELHFSLLPAGESEAFFQRLVAGDFDPDDIEAFFSRYGIDLLGPPMG